MTASRHLVVALLSLIVVSIMYQVGISRKMIADYQKKDKEVEEPVPVSIPSTPKENRHEYIPASTEDYIMNNLDELGFNKEMWGVGCKIYQHPDNTTQENYDNLHNFRKELLAYNKAIEAFNGTNTANLIQKIRSGDYLDKESQAELCKSARPHPDGIQALFPSKQLSFTKSGFVEPLLTPMRNPQMCDNPLKLLLDIDYLVHDFEAICLDLKPTSRVVLIDMGAALDFHRSGKQPVITLMKTFEKFGLEFDHIYAFEMRDQDPKKVYGQFLPKEYFHSYHWINAGMKKIIPLFC